MGELCVTLSIDNEVGIEAYENLLEKYEESVRNFDESLSVEGDK